MHRPNILAVAALAVVSAVAATPALAQSPHIIAPPDQVVAVKAGHLFDAKSGAMLSNQVVLIKGDRITDVGANLAIPAGAKVIDLSSVTVLPGMIDTHVHVNTGVTAATSAAQRALIALANAQTDLYAGFATVMDMDSRGGYNTVDLRDCQSAVWGCGCRWSPMPNQRATTIPDTRRVSRKDLPRTRTSLPAAGAGAVREAAAWRRLHRTHTTGLSAAYVEAGRHLVNSRRSPSRRSPRLRTRRKCWASGWRATPAGRGHVQLFNAGVDAPNHLLELDETGIKVLLAKKETFVPTIDDLIALEKPDLAETGGKNSRLKLMEQAFRRALAAGVTMAFGSGSTSLSIPHGKQGNQFAYFVKWGMSPAQSLQMAYLPAARMLNYGWENEIGSLDKGKFADLIAVSGNPLVDPSEMERVKFVMKGGLIAKNELAGAASNTQ